MWSGVLGVVLKPAGVRPEVARVRFSVWPGLARGGHIYGMGAQVQQLDRC